MEDESAVAMLLGRAGCELRRDAMDEMPNSVFKSRSSCGRVRSRLAIVLNPPAPCSVVVVLARCSRMYPGTYSSYLGSRFTEESKFYSYLLKQCIPVSTTCSFILNTGITRPLFFDSIGVYVATVSLAIFCFLVTPAAAQRPQFFLSGCSTET